MRLSLHTDYSLRMLMFLAQHGEMASIDQIAAAYGISRNHLMKVAARLAELGYIEPKRGRGGGIMLAMVPDEINVGAVVRSVENISGFVECFDAENNSCIIAGGCGLQGALSAALRDFLRRLDGYTLSDIVPDRNRFAKLLAAAV
ncbi:RrF2 family transcriptional regulator [Sphingorhabdus arenilitoris]|uniref:RrF2 family transcriptional regulator n=1 Tax=Sphingorhabdus arenilitoris TaxID=1490041 RepID=A0ABV8RH77_9SPHN